MKNVKYDFTGSVVLITGAARGQGRAHALSFAEAGADIIVADIGKGVESVPYELSSSERLEGVATEVEKLGAKCLPVACDVRDAGQVKAMVEQAEIAMGPIDVLVNNAGIESVYPVADMPLEAWDDMINTNLRGPFLCTQAVIPGMVARKKGKIINIGSTASFVALPSNVHYVAAKHGVIGLTRALALELAPSGINVNAVCPGAVDTPMVEGLAVSHGDWFAAQPPISRRMNLFHMEPAKTMMAPEEISYAVLWLASDASDFVTGTTVVVDTGAVIK